MKLNNLFIEDDSAYIFVSDLFEMNDLDDYMCGFHNIAISFSTEKNMANQTVYKVCFGDLVDEKKLNAALTEYFS